MQRRFHIVKNVYKHAVQLDMDTVMRFEDCITLLLFWDVMPCDLAVTNILEEILPPSSE
jgi:hypothetical protein